MLRQFSGPLHYRAAPARRLNQMKISFDAQIQWKKWEIGAVCSLCVGLMPAGAPLWHEIRILLIPAKFGGDGEAAGE